MKKNLFALVGSLISYASLTHSFEIDTHARITQEAFKQSRLFDAGRQNEKLKSLGLLQSVPTRQFSLRSFSEIPLGAVYFDMSTSPPDRRIIYSYDHRFGMDADRLVNRWEPIEIYKGKNATFLADWLSRGAVREDDAAGLVRLFKYTLQPADAPGSINRYCYHFYDPIPTNTPGLNNAGPGATAVCSQTPDDAVKWALGTTGARGEGGEDTSRKNRFTLRDAREAQWRALTIRDNTMNILPLQGLEARTFRDAYWATTFRALGSVMHLVQDMGNPQHTRNEPHARLA